MGLLWDILYGLTPLIGFIVILLVGTPFGMDAKYGLMIPFAFCQDHIHKDSFFHKIISIIRIQ